MSPTPLHAVPDLTPARPDRLPDVVELKPVRDRRDAAQTAGWSCRACDLVANGFAPEEAAYLASVHDAVMHGSAPTALVQRGPRKPLPEPTDELLSAAG